MKIRPYLEKDVAAVKTFTDTQIGEEYYTLNEQFKNQRNSISDSGENSSFILFDELSGQIHGLRLAFPPGKWAHGKGNKIRPDLWPFKLEQAAYFQSLFLSKEAQGKGFGPRLSDLSIGIFKKLGARGIVTHCWKESPNNSSLRYLEKKGFKIVIEHPLYWIDVDYVCALDGKPCRCTAIEMYLDL